MKIILVIKNGNSIWFDIHDKNVKSIPYAGNPSDLYRYLFPEEYDSHKTSWDVCKEMIGDGLEIPNNHFKLQYLCNDAEEGEDGCTTYLNSKCRNCRCKQAGFILNTTYHP
jgi:hypothetical protein